MLTLADVFEALLGVRPVWATEVVTDAVIDSRQAVPGALFVALPGERHDGHDFVADAFEHGALLALVQKEVQLGGETAILDLTDVENIQPLLTQDEPPLHPGQPVCLKVENNLEALQKIAHFWRRKLDVKVIGITGSVGKSTTKELAAEVLSQRYKTLRSPGNFNTK
jgi:UDP-N-acetylmuramoyl-tripeptide--D-alanyl-D-alanine ligase